MATFSSVPCPRCGKATVLEHAKLAAFANRGRTYEAVQTASECRNCDFRFVTAAQLEDNERLSMAARAEALAILTSDKVRAIRKSLGLTQAKAGELLGGGTNAFAKYEAGDSTPSKPMDVLLRLLGAHPALLHEVRRLHVRPAQAQVVARSSTVVVIELGALARVATEALSDIVHLKSAAHSVASAHASARSVIDVAAEPFLEMTAGRTAETILAPLH